MKFSKLTKTVFATVGILAMLAGCNSGAKSDGVTDTKADKGLKVMGAQLKYDPNHLVNDGKPIKLEYWTWADEGVDPIWKFAKEYSKVYPNVTINVKKQTWDDYWTKLPLQLKGKTGPALFNIHNSYDALIRQYAADYDLDMTALVADYPTAASHQDSNGKVKYIDSVINTGNIYYNMDMWAAAGLTEADIPQTWDQFREVAKKLTKTEGDKITQAGFNYNGIYSGLYQGLNYQKGTLLFDESGKKANFNNPTTAENMKFLQDLYNVDKVGSKDFGNSYYESFGQGQTAMIYAWGWMEGSLKEKYPKIKYGIFGVPTPSTDTPFAYDRYNGESTPGVNMNQSKEQQAVAQDFIKYILANDEFSREAVKELNSFPAKVTLQEDPEILKSPVMKAIQPRIKRLIWPGPAPATVETSAQVAFENVVQNGMSINDALAEGQKTMDTDMKSSDFMSTESKYEFFKEHK